LGADFFRGRTTGTQAQLQPWTEQDKIAAASSLLGNVSVSEIRDTNLVRISYVHEDPEQAKTLADTWVQAYIQHGIDIVYEKNLEAFNFLENKSVDYRKRLERLHQTAMDKVGMEDELGGDEPVSGEEAALSQLTSAYINANQELIEARSLLQALQEAGAADSEAVDKDPRVREIQTKIFEKESEYRSNLSIYKPEMPRMKALSSEIQTLQEQLAQEREAIFEQLLRASRREVAMRQNEVDRLKEQVDDQKRRSAIATISAQEKKSTTESTIKVLQRNLEVIDGKKEEMELALSLRDIGRTDKVVVEEATLPASPIAPSFQKHVALGGMVGFLFAAMFVFIKEVTDRNIHTNDVLEGVTGLPTLATIPRLETPKQESAAKKDKTEPDPKSQKMKIRGDIGLFTHRSPNEPFSEAYRHLRTNIQLSKTTDNRVLLLTSAVSGEGKTISSINLAVSLAQLDKKVLLVDCDLRRPKIHKVFHLPEKRGLVNMLVRHTPMEHCVHPTEVPNLFVLPAGNRPPNPAELVASQRMQELIAELKANFDYVVIDTAPILAVTDGTLLAHLVDSLIFVVKANATSRDEVGRAVALLMQNNIKPLGTLFNDYDYTQSNKYYGYKYGYRYKYGYQYGYRPYTYKNQDD
jgi:capsular exopolysaccharide synthesis family protein